MFVGGGEGGGREMDREFGVGGCRMLHLELMGDDVLLYSTGNSVWSLGLEIMENEKKRCTCMDVQQKLKEVNTLIKISLKNVD